MKVIKYLLFILLLTFSVHGYSQNNKKDTIEVYIKDISKVNLTYEMLRGALEKIDTLKSIQQNYKTLTDTLTKEVTGLKQENKNYEAISFNQYMLNKALDKELKKSIKKNHLTKFELVGTIILTYILTKHVSITL